MVVRELLIAIGFKTDGLEKVAGNVEKAREQFADLGVKAAAAATAVAAAAGALVANAADVANAALFAERQAAAFGLTVEAYQELRSTLGEFGVDQRDLADLLAQITQQASAAAGGAENIAGAFGALGIAVEDVKGAKPEAILYAIAEGAQRTTDDAARLSSVSTLLGEDLTKKALPLLIQGAEGLDAYRQAAVDLGVVMTAGEVATSKKFASNLSTLRKQVDGVRMEIGRALIPVLTRLSDRMIAYVRDNRALVSSAIDRYAARVARAFEAVGDAVAVADRVVRSRLGGWEAVALGVARAVGLVAAGFGAFRVGSGIYYGLAAISALVSAVGAALGIAFAPAAAVIGVVAVVLASVAAALGTVILLLDDVRAWFAGAPSVIGTVRDALAGLGPAGEEAARWIDETRATMIALLDVAFLVGGYVGGALVGAFGRVVAALREALDLAREFAGYVAAIPGVASFVGGFADRAATVRGVVEGGRDQLAGGASPLAAYYRAVAAPMAASALGGVGEAATAAAGSSTTITRGGDAISIVVDGARDPAATAEAIRAELSSRLRSARDAFAGGDL